MAMQTAETEVVMEFCIRNAKTYKSNPSGRSNIQSVYPTINGEESEKIDSCPRSRLRVFSTFYHRFWAAIRCSLWGWYNLVPIVGSHHRTFVPVRQRRRLPWV